MWKVFGALFLSVLVAEGCAAPWRNPRTYQDDKVYVHVVPHTHDDVGWLKTVDEYYYGGNRSISYAAVKYILDSVISELQKDENRTFIYVEMAFFTRWWKQQDDATKAIVKKLVDNKQLEFVNGGWCMNDEAGTHYNAIIDQMSLGLQFIEENFGEAARPRVAWQIDPFGHSSTMAALFAAMGFDGLFFGRQDYNDHQIRLNHSTLEMVWQPSRSLGESGDLFTGVLYNGYGQPEGFCFDTVCQNDFIQDDPNLYGYNVDKETDLFIEQIYKYTAAFVTNHIMFTMGSDFQYENARLNFDNMDKIMKYTRMKNSSIEIFYSTPSRYMDALHSADKTWPIKTDDFFPYADRPYSYWTGYFTSRPALKGYVRQMNSLLQTCSQIEAFSMAKTGKQISESTPQKLQEAMGVLQHHDAVSGTEKQHVAYDYAMRLHAGAMECDTLIHDYLGEYLKSKTGASPPPMETCEYLNVSLCAPSETNSFNLIVYNPIGRSVPHVVVVPMTTNVADVYDDKGNKMEAQISPVSEAVARVRGKRGNAEYELYFTDTLPALGMKTYFIRGKTPSNSSTSKTTFSKTESVQPHEENDSVIGNDIIQVAVDGTTGRLKYMNSYGLLSLKMDQSFYWYNSSDGKNVNSTQPSGAYIFRPNGTTAWYVNGSNPTIKINTIKGPLFQEVQQTFSDWVQQSIRVHKDFPFVEFDYIIGPIPFKDDLGKEIITRYSSNAVTNKTWYTDANGREMQKRVRNFRPTWTLNNTEPVAGNYYPVNSRIFMQYNDDQLGPAQFTVLTDRSQGGASLNDGELEIMLHRRTLYDDKRGVAEPINETGLDGQGLIIRGRHFVLLDNITNSTINHRLVGEALMLRPYSVFIRDTSSVENWIKNFPTSFSLTSTEFPPNVHLLTFKLMNDGKYLIRLEHQFEADEAPLNTPANVSLADLFSEYAITSVSELSLAANVEASVDRLKWKTEGPQQKRKGVQAPIPVVPPGFSVVLSPMQIRTFSVEMASKKKSNFV